MIRKGGKGEWGKWKKRKRGKVEKRKRGKEERRKCGTEENFKGGKEGKKKRRKEGKMYANSFSLQSTNLRGQQTLSTNLQLFTIKTVSSTSV